MLFGFVMGMPGPAEMIVIGIIAVLLFGNRLPKVARSVGQSLLSFKAGMHDVEQELKEAEKAAEVACKETTQAISQ
jgi:sec-independent protein translocase protein TatA